jgi:hypothetical protein
LIKGRAALSDDASLLTNLHKYLLQDGEELPRFLSELGMGDATVAYEDGQWKFQFPQYGVPFPAQGGLPEIEVLEREIFALLREIGRRRGVEIFQIDALLKPSTEGMDQELADANALAVESTSIPRIKRSESPMAYEALFRGLRIGWLLCRIGIRPCETMFNNNLSLRKSQKEGAKAKSEKSPNSRAAREFLQRIDDGYTGRRKALYVELEAKYKGSNLEAIKTAVRREKKKLVERKRANQSDA